MARKLRERTSKVSYAVRFPGLSGDEGEPEQPSSEDEGYTPLATGSGKIDESDFEPGSDVIPEVELEDEDAEGEEDEEDAEGEDVIEDMDFLETKKDTHSKGKAKAGATSGISFSEGNPSSTKRQLSIPKDKTASQVSRAARPSTASQGTHRPWSVYIAPGVTRRLSRLPRSLVECDNSVSQVTKGSADATIGDRVAKAWIHDLGHGPVWELVEDRGWFKEGSPKQDLGSNLTSTDKMDVDGAMRDEELRPRVYQELVMDIEASPVISSRQASRYFPSETIPSGENATSPSSISCFVGPYGSQTLVEFPLFSARPMSDFLDGSKAHIFNAGGPIWGIDWCPIVIGESEARNCKQYLAVAPFPSRDYSPIIGSRYSGPACIQIWSLSPENSVEPLADDMGIVRCEMIMGVDHGPAHQIKWCPLPSHDSWLMPGKLGHPRKLGILGGVFGDGSIIFYSVPDPEDVMSCSEKDNRSSPVCVHLTRPLLRLELPDTPFWSFDWGNSGIIVGGATNGNIAVYHIESAIKNNTTPFPSLYIPVHQAAIRSISWIRIPPYDTKATCRPERDPTIVASVSYDGSIFMTDIREQCGYELVRTRDPIMAVTFSPYAGGIISVENEVLVKWYNITPNILGRGHATLNVKGPVWDLSASDYHPFTAAGSADGSCYTTSVYKPTRRGGELPMFIHKIYQMDFNRSTKELRMLENFLPFEMSESRAAQTRQKEGQVKSRGHKDPAQSEKAEYDREGSGSWPPEVGVHRVAWNTSNGMTKCQLLASGTASGLCRIDSLWGRFHRNRVPYGSIQKIRGEDGAEIEEEIVD